MRCITPERRSVGFWALWRARVSGEAIGDLTFGPVVAEPMRLVLLSDRLSLGSGVSSLAVENLTYAASSGLMVMAGAIAVLATFGLDGSSRAAVLFALGLVGLVSIFSFIAIARRSRPGSMIASALAGLFIRHPEQKRWVDQKIDQLRKLEDYVFDFYSSRPLDLFLVVLCQIGFHLSGIFEIFVTLRLIGIDIAFSTAFMLESINRAINIAFAFVPALVGVDEAGTGIMTLGLGYGAAAGVALAIIRKIRMLFWIGVGLALIFVSKSGQGRIRQD
jgi:hypothetical protein